MTRKGWKCVSISINILHSVLLLLILLECCLFLEAYFKLMNLWGKYKQNVRAYEFCKILGNDIFTLSSCPYLLFINFLKIPRNNNINTGEE